MAEFVIRLTDGSEHKFDLGANIAAVKSTIDSNKSAQTMILVPGTDTLIDPDSIAKVDKI